MTPTLIAIAGGSGSGKTSLATTLAQQLGPQQATLLSLDSYYRDQKQLTAEQRTKTNYDHPAAIEFTLAHKQLALLLDNQKIEQPIYSFVSHTREGTTLITPTPLIILEGIFALYDSEIRHLLNYSIFVDALPEIRFSRRQKRDIAERGRTPESVKEQWESTVEPMFQEFIYPTRLYAQEIITNNDVQPAPFTALAQRLIAANHWA